MDFTLPDTLISRLHKWCNSNGNIVVLTGAGISAESGIPTFRGKEGYWTVGSKEYHPKEMATKAMFKENPEAVWAWYLYRRNVCNKANPNAGHFAITELERLFSERFRLLTQNVDGLHLRAGNTLDRTYQVHGNVNYARCAYACRQGVWLIPKELDNEVSKKNVLTEQEKELLHCPKCNNWARPHILWFDEYYDEEYYHYQSSIRAAISAEILLVVGTSGATNLPIEAGQRAAQTGALIIDVNIETNPFSDLAQEQGGFFLQGLGASILPELLKAMKK